MQNSAARLLPIGTVVLSRTASVGFAGIMALPMATTQDFANWIPGRDLTSSYLLYALRAMKPELERLMVGSTHKTIYMPDIRELRIPLPPKGEQEQIGKYIAAQLSPLHRAVDALMLSIAKLLEYRQSLISAAVTGTLDINATEAA